LGRLPQLCRRGTFTITVTISDGNGASDPLCAAGTSGTASATIVDAAPTISASNLHLCEGDAGTNTATVVEYDDGFTVTKTSGPGSVTAAGVWSTTGLAVGSYPVGLHVVNGDGSFADTSFTVTVGNDAPSVSNPTVTGGGGVEG